MKINQEQVKSLLKAMDYLPEDGVSNIISKKRAESKAFN